MTALDAALAIGVLVQVTKLADIMLLPHQQEWVQETCEELDYFLLFFRDEDLYRKATKFVAFERIQAAALRIVTGWLLFLLSIEGRRPFLPIGEEHSWWIDPSLILGAWLAYFTIGRPFRRWLWRIGHVDGGDLSFQRLFAFAGIAAVPTLWLCVGALIAGMNYGSDAPAVWWSCMMLGASMLAVIAGTAGTAFVTTVLVCATRLVLYAFSVALFFVRVLLSRIVEYNKGAWAGITLLATFGLGVADIYVKTMPASDTKSEVTAGDPVQSTGLKQETATVAPATTKP